MGPQETIAHYRIVAKLGEGGMGEVWQATDTKLNRDVAIKVLPEPFAQDADRMARFQREAQVLASLNHPNIAAIHGVEERALILELVEGPTLAARIGQGPIPLEEALPIARQIAEALEYAHERGVVHRDLKPANIKVTAAGRVKVLDFGLAKALSHEAAAGSPASTPTLTMRGSIAGVILGTAGYMSPEQARGQLTDQRADIWSFGVVFYEMATGRRLFDGPTISDCLAAVLRAEPDWSALPADVPPNIRTMLRRCLARDPKARLRDIGDARLELEQPAIEAVPPHSTPPVRPRRLPWAVAIVMTIAAAVAGFQHFRRTAVTASPIRFAVPPPEKGHFGAWLALSPDGRHLGFTAASQDGIGRIFLRALDSLELRALTGTEGAITFFWSPDSRFVVFQSGGKLKKIDISGGPAQTLCDGVTVLLGGSWNAEGVILFGSNNGPIMRVSSAGGVAVPVTRLEASRDEGNHTDPIFLPDGRHFIYIRRSTNAGNAGIYAGSLDVKPEQQSLERIQATDYSAGYSPPHDGLPGHLLFLREENLLAQVFDERRLEAIGEPVPIAEQIGTSITRAFLSASGTGVLAHRTGGGEYTQFSWFTRDGRMLGHAGEPGGYDDVALSPDGSRIAFSPRVGTERQIWIMDTSRGTKSRLTFLPDGVRSPAWSPDGQYLAFSSVRGRRLYIKNANNSGAEQVVLDAGAMKFLNDWSRDGRFLIYTEVAKSLDVMAVAEPLSGGEHRSFAVADSGFNETQGELSPDGRWIAYVSDESGKYEIYVRPFPPGDGRGGKWLVSSAGGVQPHWRADGKELFYISPDQKLMAADIRTEPGFQSFTPHPLFATPTITAASNVLMRYSVTPDGKKFLLVDVSLSEGVSPVTVVLNWESLLRQ